MKVYIAARFHEKEKVKKIYTLLEQKGCTITQDWTTCTTQKPYHQHRKDAQECARHAIQGVKECDIFIYLTNPEIGAGSSTEFGAALMSRISFGFPTIYIVGPERDTNICFYHPTVQLKHTIEEVLEEISQKIA